MNEAQLFLCIAGTTSLIAGLVLLTIFYFCCRKLDKDEVLRRQSELGM